MLMISVAVTAVHVMLAICCILERKKRKDWIRKKIVYLPFSLAGMGMFFGSIFCLLTIVCAQGGDWVIPVFATLALACDCLMIAYLNCVIRYDNKGFEARNFFGIKRSCDFGDVEALRPGRTSKVYFQGDCLLIDTYSLGIAQFVDTLDEGHKQSNGSGVPYKERRPDPMNGNLDHPWGYFILAIVMMVGCIAIAALGWYSITAEIDPADVTIREVQFTDCQVREGDLLLSVQGEERPFRIDYYEEYEEVLPSREELCNGQKFLMGVEKGSYGICILTMSDGTELITMEMERQVYRDRNRVAVWVLTVFSVLGVWGCYMMIAVARNPERYPTWVRRLFYRSTTLK